MADILDRLKTALADRYTIERELGRGGMATVYLAEDLKHHRKVAVKVLRPELAAALGPERFHREIEIAAQLTHPNVLTLIDSGDADGFLYYVMPYIEGQSLRDKLAKEGELPIGEAVRILRDVVDALDHAHKHGVVHRDIKPDNVLLSERHALVTDFGVAKAVSEATGAQKLTTEGVALGTPAYMSPEQAVADEKVDHRSDIYAVGALAYELLTGRPPFLGTTPQMVLSAHVADVPDPVTKYRDTVSPALERLVLRCLEKRPADRWQSAEELLVQLEALATPSDGMTPTATRPVATVATQRRKRVAWSGTAAAMAVVVAVGVWWMVTGGTGGGSAPIERLAVLPFTNMTGNPEQQNFVDAMHDAVIAELAQIRTLMVISRQSVLRYTETQKSVPEIAQELRVDGVVEASVFRAGDTVRITVQLLRARPAERRIWGRTFQRPMQSVLALQGEVARAIVGGIELAVTPSEARRLARARPVDPAAYQAWLSGWVERNTGTGPAIERCVLHANEAVAIDADYGAAHALAAECHLLRYWTGATPAPSWDAFPQAKAAAQRAIAVDSSLGQPHAILGLALAAFDWDWSGADRAFTRALDLTPGDAIIHIWYSFFLSWMGRHEEALEHARRAEQLSPGIPFASSNLTSTLVFARRYDEAVAQGQRTVELYPEYGFGHGWLAAAYELKGMYQESLAERQEAVRVMGEADVMCKAGLGRAYAHAGRRGDALQILDDLLRLQRTSYVHPVLFTYLYIGLGQTDDAIDWLERGYDDRDADMAFLKTHPTFDPLRSDPRFQELLRRMDFPD